MALIQETNKYNKGKAEMRIEIRNTACDRKFTFILHANHIEIEPKANGHGPNWQIDLTPEEKLQVFNKILAQYRQRSMGDGGFKLAALGITENGDIYIAENTEQISTDFHRQCAEQNMVTISSQRDVYRQKHDLIVNGGDLSFVQAKHPRYKAVYLMGGREPDIMIACPCGNCTDLLAKVMDPEAEIIILPLNDGNAVLTMNTNAKMARDCRAGEAWQTTIGHLNKDRVVVLNEKQADLQRNALYHLAEELSGPLQAAYNNRKQRFSLEPYRQEQEKRILGPATKRVAHMTSDGPINPSEQLVNQLHHDDIKDVALNRLMGVILRASDEQEFDLTTEGIVALLKEHVSYIRSAIIQMDGGSTFNAVSSRVKGIDVAGPSAEVTALNNASKFYGTEGAYRLSVVEFNPRDIEDGVMRTSPKESLERLAKMRSKLTGTVECGYTPYNTGRLTREQVQNITAKRMMEELFPGYFTGKDSARQLDSIAYTLGNRQGRGK